MSLKRVAFMALGCISLALAVLGVVLPILPTVPFLALAAFCFAKSSDRLNNWLINTKFYLELSKQVQRLVMVDFPRALPTQTLTWS